MRIVPFRKAIRLLAPALALLFVPAVIARANETNGFLVIQIERPAPGGADPAGIKQRFKIPLTEEFMANFKNTPGQSSEGTGFCCAGGNLKTDQGSTAFMWWIHRTADHRWRINMWGEGVETLKGVTISSRNGKTSQNVTVKSWEDIDMSYMITYGGNFTPAGSMNVMFTAKYVPAREIDAEGYIPTPPVQKSDRTVLFKGDDLSKIPLEIRCLFQEG